MKKTLSQPNSQFVNFQIDNFTITKVLPYFASAIKKSNRIIFNDEYSFDGFNKTFLHTPYNSGYIEDRFQIDMKENEKKIIVDILLKSFNYPTDLISWEIYFDNQIMLACNHSQSFISINKSLLNE